MRAVIFLGAAIVLAGCQTSDDDPYKMDDADLAAIRQGHDKTCQSFGAKPGTEFYFNCRYKLAEKEMASRDAMQAQRIARMRRQADQLRNVSVNSFTPPPRQQMNCTSGYTPAGTIRTNCY